MFSGTSAEELLFYTFNAMEVFRDVLAFDERTWFQEWSKTLRGDAKDMYREVIKEALDAGQAYPQTKAGFWAMMKAYVKKYIPDPKARETQIHRDNHEQSPLYEGTY